LTHPPTTNTQIPKTEYATFWSRVQVACQRYLTGVNEGTVETMYAYLDEGNTANEGAAAAVGDAAETCTLGDASTDDAGSHSMVSLLEFDMDVEEDESIDEGELPSGVGPPSAPAVPLAAAAAGGGAV
jgi:hypothetical protein